MLNAATPSAPRGPLAPRTIGAVGLPTRAVRRPRLISLLDEGSGVPLTLVIAPPGSGKTVLLSQWLADHEGSASAWLRLDAAHDDERLFWTAMVEAVERLDPAAGAAARRVLRHHVGALAAGDFVASLAEALGELRQPGVLVLDDFHAISEPAVTAGLARLLQLMPESLRLVIASRLDPALPLHRMRAEEAVEEVRQADLRFTLDETRELLDLIVGQHLDIHDVAALYSRTEGWATGLHLAALSMRRHPDPASVLHRVAGSDQQVADYLVAEVLERQPTEVRRFLLGTSILDTMSAPLCDALLGGNDSAAMLHALQAANLFVVSLDQNHTWYRYHHMFRDMLQQQLRIDAGQWESTLHRAAADWYRRNADPTRAVLHLLAAGDTDQAFTVVDEHIESCPDPPLGLVRDVSVHAFDAAYIGADPTRMITYALVLLSTGRSDVAVTWLREAEERLRPEARDPLVARRLHRAWLLLDEAWGDADGVIREATALRDSAEAAGDDSMAVRALASLMRMHVWLDDYDAARAAYATALARVTGVPSPLRRLVLPGVLAHVAAAEGSLREAERLVAVALGSDFTPVWKAEELMDPWLARAMVLRERNNLDAAEVVLRHLLDLAERTRHVAFIGQTLVELAKLRYAQGRTGEAIDVLAQARRVRAFSSLPDHLLDRVQGFECKYWIAAGDIERARAALSLVHGPRRAQVLAARLDLAERQPRRALERLAARDAGGMARSEAITYHLVAARAALGVDIHLAEQSMRQALDLGRPEGFVRKFLDEGEDVVRLLRRLSASDPSAYVRELIAAGQGLVAAPPPSPPELFEPLSHRERTVLKLLPSQLSNQEIAGELHVSLNTVKTHLKSIYRKLDATSRSQAIRRARTLKVL